MTRERVQLRINVDTDQFRERMRNLTEAINAAGFSTGEFRQAMQSLRGPMMLRGTEYRHQGRGEGPRLSDLHGPMVIPVVSEPPTVQDVLAPPNRRIVL